MFLNLLQEEEKYNYLQLAMKAAHINGVFEEEEKKLINAYQREMNIIGNITEYDQQEEIAVFRTFAESELSHKKIVLFELIGFLSSDSDFDDDEKAFVARFCNETGMSVENIEIISQSVAKYYSVISEIAELIFVS